MAVKVGDKVKLLNEKGEGTVLEIPAAGRVRVEIDGFDYDFSLSEVLIISSDNPEEATFELDQGKIDRVQRTAAPTITMRVADADSGPVYRNPVDQPIRRNHSGTREIDLHLHQLVERESHLSNGEKLEIQLSRFETELQAAMRSHERKIVFIHGVGEGVLKKEIRARLALIDGIEFYDGSWAVYGQGATEVEIHKHR